MSIPRDERYRRQLELPEVGPAGQARLASASALVVGAGGLGCAALPYLAAAGLRRVVVCDGDVVEASNLPRQVLYGDGDVGRPKAASAVRRLAALNADCQLAAVDEPLGPANTPSLVAAADVVIDATDDPAARFLLHDACFAARRPLVSAAVHHDEGQLAVFRFDIAAAGPCWRCLWPTPPANPDAGCRGRGILGPVPGVLGAMQADQALRVLLEASPLAQGSLLHVDLAGSATWRTSWRPEPACPLCAGAESGGAPVIGTGPRLPEEVDWDGVESPAACLWVDARTEAERARDPEPRGLAGLPSEPWRSFGAEGPPPGRPCIVFCAHGIRSLDLARHWRRRGCANVSSLRGGLAARRGR